MNAFCPHKNITLGRNAKTEWKNVLIYTLKKDKKYVRTTAMAAPIKICILVCVSDVITEYRSTESVFRRCPATCILFPFLACSMYYTERTFDCQYILIEHLFFLFSMHFAYGNKSVLTTSYISADADS
jgi:hypothetical protein